jgi:hypothetical protein
VRHLANLDEKRYTAFVRRLIHRRWSRRTRQTVPVARPPRNRNHLGNRPSRCSALGVLSPPSIHPLKKNQTQRRSTSSDPRLASSTNELHPALHAVIKAFARLEAERAFAEAMQNGVMA